MIKSFCNATCFSLIFSLAVITNSFAAAPVDNTLQPKGAVIVPDQFLRSWDPVTIFFGSKLGKTDQAEDHPEKFVTLTPKHPGAYTWLNATTLQFRPIIAWNPLTRYRWHLQKGSSKIVELETLVSAPQSSIPANGNRDLEPVESITLSFKTPLEVNALKEMLSIELRPLPGIDNSQSHWLSADDFEIKVIERSRQSDAARYVINLFKPIPYGTKATVHLRLALSDNITQSFQKINFSTAKPFELANVGCNDSYYPITVTGSQYGEKQAIECDSNNREFSLNFSSSLSDSDPVALRNLVHITPAIDDLSYNSWGHTVSITGKFKPEQVYRINIEPSQLAGTQVKDQKERPLNLVGSSELYLYFPARSRFLHWDNSGGVMERFGPQTLPLTGRGHERIDVRIHPINALDRNFWPFTNSPIETNDEQRPEGPGETPKAHTSVSNSISRYGLQQQIKALGAPTISEIVNIPLKKQGVAAKFGLDLSEHLARIKGKNKPGTYLVGLRNLDNSDTRSWVRVQVTDLSLSAINEPEQVRFVVTSLKTGQPVSGAQIMLEGEKGEILNVATDSRGLYNWRVPYKLHNSINRIVISKGDDQLVINPKRPPEIYKNNLWKNDHNTWLGWTYYRNDNYGESGQELCHLFSERPVYKPEEAVHIKGYVRNVVHGEFSNKDLREPQLIINGPGNMEWIFDVEMTENGSFYWKFDEEKLPTGHYQAYLSHHHGSCGSFSFKKEAYRLPKFEVTLTGPQKTGLDKAFDIKLSAEYYAGGLVAGQPVNWQVTQFPYTWTPKKQSGFYYSTNARFSRNAEFESSSVLTSYENTDDSGASSISIDPTKEPTAQPRRYVIEATVTGADDQSVSTTFETIALPPVVLGLKVPRYTQKLNNIKAEIIVANEKGEFKQDQKVKIKMHQRQWHSHLQAGDFSQGVAKYVTEVVDEKVFESSFVSTTQLQEIKLPIEKSGVYIVEIETLDDMGRLQSVKVDLFAGGDEPVSWSKQATKVFKVTPEKSSYAPGEQATLILQSPYQNARALAIVEQANGNNIYSWIDIKNGSGTFKVMVNKVDLPKLPVHFLLMRGRTSPAKAGSIDLGKPSTLAATVFIPVSTVKHQVKVDLKHPKKAQPGDEIEISINLKDDQGKPLSGEVTLWLVDQSVLALGKEQRIDPLPDFIPFRDSYSTLRDTRDSVLGYFPYQEQPGGGIGEQRMASSLLDNVTVRKNFKTVPYFNGRIMVERSGKKTVKVQLPDNLTNFKIRAKVVSGYDRFGFAKSQIAVRLPVLVQPSLPRFVRPGDQFTAIAIGRVVEGEGGPGIAQVSTEGLTLTGSNEIKFEWQKKKPQRIEFDVSVPTPQYNAQGELERQSVSMTLAVNRNQDNARDAFKKELPIKADRKAIKIRKVVELKQGKAVDFAAIEEALRPGSFKHQLLVSNQPALIQMAGGLNYLLEYPHGCSEQRISKARAVIASQRFDALMSKSGDEQSRTKIINDTLSWLEKVQGDDGLISYWPGSNGYVSLSAWTLMFMVEAKQAGYPINKGEYNKLVRVLKQALRSDYQHYITGASYEERTWALLALTVANETNGSYAAELARKSRYLNVESLAQVVVALSQSKVVENNSMSLKQLNKLYDELWSNIVLRLHQGEEMYAGLQQNSISNSALILPSETRTLAQVLRAATLTPKAIIEKNPKRKQVLINAIVTLGQGNGWGSTNANASALIALSEVLESSTSDAVITLDIKNGEQSATLDLKGKAMASTNLPLPAKSQVVLTQAPKDQSVILLSSLQYLPKADGSHVKAFANGFVVSREQQLIQDNGAPAKRIALDKTGFEINYLVGQVVEEHVELINPSDANHVAVLIPLAAGMEPLNPALATAPPEAKTDGELTLTPTYVAFMDDQLAYFYDSLPKGTYQFYFRTKASIPGRFIQPAASAEKMYDEAINGNSFGAKIIITKPVATDKDASPKK